VDAPTVSSTTMSDINFQFPWWTQVMFVLIEAFWPLTIAALAAGIWVCFARHSHLAWIVAILVAIPWLISAGANAYGRIDDARSRASMEAYDRAHRKTLPNDAVVDGMHLAAGTVLVTDDAFKLSSLELSKPAVLFGVPLTGTVGLLDGKLHGSQTLQYDTVVDGLPCASDSVSFDHGSLTDCRLTRPTTIGGVPCTGYVNIHAGFLGCVLAEPYNRYGVTWYAGTDVRGGDDYLTFTIGPRSPSLRVYGSPLQQGTIVVYRRGTIASVTFLNAPIRYRGCTITALERRDGGMTAEVNGPCSLPALPNGRVSVPNL
jgi:hypothetical protein